MIPCNGSHILYHRTKHGDSAYRCTLENAQRILQHLVAGDAARLKRLYDSLSHETRPIRSEDWLVSALREIRSKSSPPQRLKAVIYGSADTAENPANSLEVSNEMQEELVVFFLRQNLSLDALGWKDTLTTEELSLIWSKLDCLKEARNRVGAEIVFLSDYDYEGYRSLAQLLNAKWKETAKEENIVANYYCPFFNDWASGHWSVERLIDA